MYEKSTSCRGNNNNNDVTQFKIDMSVSLDIRQYC